MTTTYRFVNDALEDLGDRDDPVPKEDVIDWVTENHDRKPIDVIEAIEALEKRGDVYSVDDKYRRTMPNEGVRA